MIELNIELGTDTPKLTMYLESINLFNRHKNEIEYILKGYLFKFNTENIRNEIQEKISIILNSDIINIRKEKLKQLNKKCGIDNFYNNNFYNINIEHTKIN